MKASIPRTATFSWSPAALQAAEPYIATGTVAGALDENFSNESVIEIWKPDYANRGTPAKPIANVSTSAKLNRLAWGLIDANHPKGVLAAGLENGELGIWDAQKVMDGNAANAQILKNTHHTGPIKGLDFSHKQNNLLATGAVNGEIYIWDLLNPAKPYSPGAPSSKLDEITSLAWNSSVAHILASASSTGYTIVWDLRNKREVVQLSYGGGVGTAGAGHLQNGAGGAASALTPGGRRGMSAVAWHPEVATRVATASDDDSSPVIMLWDLRNARAPEKILTGHDKGVLSLSWCKQDSDLLLSCGKDNRTIAWNPQTTEIVGELPASNNWSFDVQWCPRNPELLAAASFDGQVGIHSLQSTNQAEQQQHNQRSSISAPPADGSDIFNLPASGADGSSSSSSQGLTLKQPPKWLKRPVSATFGYGGQLVSVANLPGASGATQSSVVHLRDVVTEPGIVSRAQRLQEAIDGQSLAQFCNERSKEAAVSRPDDVANWKALQTLFQADSRDELVALLGFSKEDVAAKVTNAIATYKSLGSHAGAGTSVAGLDSTPGTPSVRQGSLRGPASTISEPDDGAQPHEPVVSFADHAAPETLETTPSEVSTAVSSEPKATTEGGESEVTEPSLFSSEGGEGANGAGAGADQSGLEFFNSISGESGAGVRSAVPERVLVPHVNVPPASSVAATAGSPGPSSVASADIRPATFRIYPSDESEADRLITRALVLGDFESAVSLCVSTERFADALLLAVRGGPDLLARTQKTYFERRTTSLPYLRVFQSIVSDDLTDIVQNADLNEWQEIFVVLCTFAKPEEFSNLAEQLGQRLEFQYVKSSRAPSVANDAAKLNKAKSYRKNAILCYLAAGKLEKVAGMWIEEMKEEEAGIRNAQKQLHAADAGAADATTVNGSSSEANSLYSAHAEALQTFIEKITVFQNAVGYVDADLQQPTTSAEVAASGARTYKLSALYDRIHEYVELLADQGLISSALKYIDQTPADYASSISASASSAGAGSSALGAHPARERLLQADTARTGGQGAASAAASTSRAAAPATSSYAPAATTGYDPYGAVPTQQAVAQDPYGAGAYGAPSQPQQTSYGGVYAPSVPQVPQVQAQPPAGPYGGMGGGYNPAPQPPSIQSNNAYAPQQPMVPAPPAINEGAYGLPPSQQQPHQAPPAAAAPPPPPPKRAEGGWNDVPTMASNAPKRTASALGQKAAPIMSPFPNSPAPTPGPYGQQYQQGGSVPPPPRGSTPGARSFASPPPQGPGFGRGGPQAARPPPPPRAGSAAGLRGGPPGPPQPGSVVPPVPGIPNVPQAGPGQGAPQSGPYAPQQQQQQRGPPGPSGPYGPPPGQQHPQQQQQPGLGGVPPPGPPGVSNLGPPGAARPPPGAPINRSQTPGAGAGAPNRSQTPGAGGRPGAASQFKYPPGDRSHIPESQRGIFATLSREFNRIKSVTPPAQKRMVDDSERRLNLLFDHLNNGLISDQKFIAGLVELSRAVDARNQQAALGIHVQLVTSASGDVAAALVGVKFVISRLAV
ncbi:unnamed protein product [Sympodiomycopsis kandeliae]